MNTEQKKLSKLKEVVQEHRKLCKETKKSAKEAVCNRMTKRWAKRQMLIAEAQEEAFAEVYSLIDRFENSEEKERTLKGYEEEIPYGRRTYDMQLTEDIINNSESVGVPVVGVNGWMEYKDYVPKVKDCIAVYWKDFNDISCYTIRKCHEHIEIDLWTSEGNGLNNFRDSLIKILFRDGKLL